MWKLLSGIALILLLDIVFIWMIEVEPDAPEIARAIGPAAASPVIHEAPVAPPQAIDDSIEPIEPDDRIIRGSRDSRGPTRARPRRSFGGKNPTMSATAPANLFPDRIIWIGRTEVLVKVDERQPVAIRREAVRSGEIQADVTEERPVKKRSIQSRAVGVIKKPYELMKAFADKFN